jgi:hypothetical protein
VTATRLALQAGAGGGEVAAAYYLALLDHIGCTAGNLSFTANVGDEMTGRGEGRDRRCYRAAGDGRAHDEQRLR